MDELIKRFQDRAAAAQKLQNMQRPDSLEWHRYYAIASTLRDCIMDVREAKRRMAEREPAWDVQS